MHFDYEPGLYGMADFSGKTIALRSGRGETDLEIFVAVLAHSNLPSRQPASSSSSHRFSMIRTSSLAIRCRKRNHMLIRRHETLQQQARTPSKCEQLKASPEAYQNPAIPRLFCVSNIP